MRRIYLVASGSHGQLFSIDRGIHFHCAGDNIGIVLTRGVQAFALNHHLAAIHLIAGQIAVLQLRRAGGQRRASGIDKAAAVTGNAGRTGDNDLRLLACHLDIAVQAARRAGIDFVENDFGLAFRHPRVGADHAAQLRRGVPAGVIEDNAFFIDIELAIGVARDATGGWRLDIDLRRTVGSDEHRGLLLTRHGFVGHDGGLRRVHGPDRQPETKAKGAQAAHQAAEGMNDAGRGRTARTGARNLGRHHQHATGFIKHNAIQKPVHR